VEIGSQSCISPEALAFCFELAAMGSAAEGAALDIVAAAGDALILKSMEIEEVN
jgi:Zn finger protein HypA/HybF involved in hydrogenase expression